MGHHDVIDHIKVSLRDGVTAPDAAAATDRIDHLTHDDLIATDELVTWAHLYSGSWDVPVPDDDANHLDILRRDLATLIEELGSDRSIEYEEVGYDAMPEGTAHVHRLRATGVLKAAGLVAYEPVITWIPWEER